MNSNTKGFIFIVILVAAIVGGLIFMNNRQKNGSQASPQSSGDTGDVAGVSASSDPNKAPVTTSLNPDNKSDSYIASLAKFMTTQGMTLYGASWCPHCNAQRAAFGVAASDLKYVECSTDATKPQADVCSNITFIDTSTGKNSAGITGYPTWVYQGKGYAGEQTITQLAQIVGYVDGSTAPASTNAGSN
ncbi:MAG: hypothetical protein Q7S80_02375 [bacterium]|nr:hypothetical protein [bacterium]